MKSNGGLIRLKLSTAGEQLMAPSDQETGHLSARALAKKIAAHTVKVLLGGEMLDPASAADELLKYGNGLDKGLHVGQCILHSLFPDEGRLAMVLHWLNSQVNLHVWEIAHRISPAELFYKAHPKVFDACKLCGAVVLDASNPSTLTTGSINPLTGEFLAPWIQTELEYDPSELRPRFFFHVVIPPRHWSGIMRSHFRHENVL
jgi:hypothetical protein